MAALDKNIQLNLYIQNIKKYRDVSTHTVELFKIKQKYDVIESKIQSVNFVFNIHLIKIKQYKKTHYVTELC